MQPLVTVVHYSCVYQLNCRCKNVLKLSGVFERCQILGPQGKWDKSERKSETDTSCIRYRMCRCLKTNFTLLKMKQAVKLDLLSTMPQQLKADWMSSLNTDCDFCRFYWTSWTFFFLQIITSTNIIWLLSEKHLQEKLTAFWPVVIISISDWHCHCMFRWTIWQEYHITIPEGSYKNSDIKNNVYHTTGQPNYS